MNEEAHHGKPSLRGRDLQEALSVPVGLVGIRSFLQGTPDRFQGSGGNVGEGYPGLGFPR